MPIKIKGCLEVRAVLDTRRGFNPEIVPAGTVGYVISARGDRRLVKWRGSAWPASHAAADLEPTGRSG